MPLLNSATGRLFAAYLPRTKTAALLDGELRDARRSERTELPRTTEAFDSILAEVRERRAARVVGSLMPAVHAFCMPVFDAVGDLALGVIVLGQEGLFDSRWGGEVDRALRACARQLSYELGNADHAGQVVGA